MSNEGFIKNCVQRPRLGAVGELTLVRPVVDLYKETKFLNKP